MALQQLPLREAQLTLVAEILTDSQKYKVSYTPDAKVLIELHLQQVLTCYTSLSVKYEEYTYNDGRTIGMIKVTGTIPIVYSRSKYNIPVTFWINERYPRNPPIVYVTPTPDMVIKTDHTYVDASGYVHTPYFTQWHGDRSDLLELVKDMANVFGQEPPLFAKVYQQRVQHASFSGSPNPQTHGYPPFTNPQVTPVVYSTQPQQSTFQPLMQPPHQTVKPAHSERPVIDLDVLRCQFRDKTMDALADRIGYSISVLAQESRPKAQKSDGDQVTLKQRAHQIQAGIAMLQEERETYEQNVQVMDAIVREMMDWNSKVRLPESSRDNDYRAEDVIVPQDPLAAQSLKAQAEDLAAEDALNTLDQLFKKEVIDLDTYLKQIRNVCRVQYFARALSMKIGETHQRPQ